MKHLDFLDERFVDDHFRSDIGEFTLLPRLHLLRIGSKFLCIRSTPTEMQSMRENDFECLARTGVKSPLNTIFRHTMTRRPTVNRGAAICRESSLNLSKTELPPFGVSRSRTPNIFMPSGETAYSSLTTRCGESSRFQPTPRQFRDEELAGGFLSLGEREFAPALSFQAWAEGRR